MRMLIVVQEIITGRKFLVLLVFLVLSHNVANSIELERVHAKNVEGAGVVVQIFLVDSINEPEPVGWTGSDGIWPEESTHHHICKSSQRVMVQPDSMQRYRVPEQKPCKARVEFELRPRNIVGFANLSGRQQKIYGNLASHLTVAIERSQYGDVTQIYSDMATLLRTSNVDEARDFGAASYIFAARALGVEKPLANTSPGLTQLMSPELRAKIAGFQSANELPTTTGRLDSVTLQALSGKPFWYFQYEPVDSVFKPDAKVKPPASDEFLSSLTATYPEDSDIIVLAQRASEAGGSPATAARYYNEIAHILRQSDKEEGRAASDLAEYYTYELAGRVLNVDSPTFYDWRQGKYVMSPEMSESLIDFKQIQGLPERKINDVLDFEILRILSATSSKETAGN